MPALAPGDPIGRYTITGVLGAGGMGEVFSARDPELERDLAIKILRTDVGGATLRARGRFMREAQALARLTHPNVVAVYDVGTVADHVFVAMERIDGFTLRAWLAMQRRPWREVRDVLLAAGRGLAAAHAVGIVHRDFKPHNVMVGSDDRVVVLDFGLARQAADDSEPDSAPRGDLPPMLTLALTETHGIVGTPLYMSPEQLAGRPATTQSDQWSFCVTAYEALFGQLPFQAESLPALAAGMKRGAPAPVDRRGLPRWLTRTVLRGLALEPAARHASMGVLLRRLARDPGRWIRAGIAIAAVAVIVGVLTLVALNRQAERSLAVLYEEQGRQAALQGSSLHALVYLAEAMRRGVDGPATQLLVGRAARTLEAQRLELAGHSGAVWTAAWSPDGNVIASAGEGGSIRLWDAAGGDLLRVLAGHSDRVLSLAFSPDGKKLASGGRDRTVRVWDVRDGRLLAEWAGHGDSVYRVAFAPDGDRVVSTAWAKGYDHAPRLWSLSHGGLVATLAGHTRAVVAIAFTPDGQRIVTGGDDGSVRVWDGASGAPIATVAQSHWPVHALAIDRGGRFAVSGGSDRVGRVIDLEQGAVIATLNGHAEEIDAVAVSPDGTRVATAGRDGTARIWDLRTGEAIHVLIGHTAQVQTVVFSPDGDRVLTTSRDGTAKLWATLNGAMLASFDGQVGVRLGAFAPSGARAMTAGFDGTVRVWDVLHTETRPFAGPGGPLSDADIDPTGTRALVTTADGRARLVDAATGATLFERDGVIVAKLAPDGVTAALGLADGTVVIHRAADGAPVATLRGHTGAIEDLMFSRDGARLMTGSEDKSARVWRIDGAREELRVQAAGTVHTVFLGRTRAFTVDEHQSSLWDVATGTAVGTFDVFDDPAVNPAETLIATGGSGGATVWDAAGGKVVARFAGQAGSVFGVRFSPDGRLLAAHSEDGSIAVWDVGARRLEATLEGHGLPLKAMEFEPAGHLLVTGGWDKTVRLWSLDGYRELAILRPHAAVMRSLHIAPTGELITASDDGTFSVWSPPRKTWRRDELAALVRCHVPYTLVGGRIAARQPLPAGQVCR